MYWASAGSAPPVFHRVDGDALQRRSSRGFLSKDEVQVWTFSLDATPEIQGQCRQWLSRAELDRADRFKFEADRSRFIVAHGCLRHIVSSYCDATPGEIRIVQSAGGKPALAQERGRQHPLKFNLAHSHGRGIVAVSEEIEIGVDLEQIRIEVDHLKLAGRFFSHAEQDCIRTETGVSQRPLFFRHWVAKEAMLKAKGIGLLFPLDRCEIVLCEEEDEALGYCRDLTPADTPWLIRFLPLDIGWVGAVAAQGSDWTVTYCHF